MQAVWRSLERPQGGNEGCFPCQKEPACKLSRTCHGVRHKSRCTTNSSVQLKLGHALEGLLIVGVCGHRRSCSSGMGKGQPLAVTWGPVPAVAGYAFISRAPSELSAVLFWPQTPTSNANNAILARPSRPSHTRNQDSFVPQPFNRNLKLQPIRQSTFRSLP